MEKPKYPIDEEIRLQALKDLNILDTPLEAPYDALTRLAQQLYKTNISAISLLDSERQWFKSIQGLDAKETPRDISFCGHAILQDEILLVNNALLDFRFSDNPLVTGDPKIRFYAGCPIKYRNKNIGTLCVIDNKSRNLTKKDLTGLKDLAILLELILKHRETLILQSKHLLEIQELKGKLAEKK